MIATWIFTLLRKFDERQDMNRLIRFFLEHTLLVKIIFIAVFVFGIHKMLTIQKEGFPSVDLNVININTNYPGASAEDVELNVTSKLEEELENVDGIQEVISVSRENSSNIIIQADESASRAELYIIVDDINQAVNKTRDLPLDLDGLPVVDVVSTSDTPIISIDLFGDHDKLRKMLPILESGIEAIPGVSGVDKIGYFDREVHIEIDPIKARELRVSLSDVLRAIQARNLRTTGGTLESYLDEKTVVSLNKFKDPRDVANVILRSDITGNSIRIRDLAEVKILEKNETFIVRNKGKPGMSLVVRKKVNDDIIATLDKVKDFMSMKSLPEGVGYSYSNDMSAKTRLRLQVLGGNALIGFALVALILMLAISRQAAFWTAVSVPFSLFGAFILLSFSNMSLNAISLAGFVLVLGLLVDDAIVVAEKITYYKEKGLQAVEAAYKGTSEMWRPVFVASVTTILAFTPMFYLGGKPGKFAWAIPAVVILALLVSLFESFFILPHHLAKANLKKSKDKPRWVEKLEDMYTLILHKLLHKRIWVVVVMLLLLFGSVFLAVKAVKFQLFPQEGVERFFIKLEMPRGASLSATEKRLMVIEKLINALPESELESYSTRVGTLSTSSTKNRGDHSHWGIISVFLTGEAHRERTADQIIRDLRFSLETGAGENIIFEKKLMGPAIGKPVEIRISTNNESLRENTAQQLMEHLRKLPGVLDVESDNKPGKDQLVVDINYQKLAEVGLTVKDVAEALRVTYDGMLVSSTTSVDETIEYRVIVSPKYRGLAEMIYKIPVKNDKGQVLSLKDVLTLRNSRGPLEFNHVNGIRTTIVSAEINSKLTSIKKVQQYVSDNLVPEWKKSPQMTVKFAGEARETKRVMGDFLIAGTVALISIYLVVALLLNSMGQAFIVMTVIPFAIIGVIWAFFFHGTALSFFATMGTLGLIGVVVNDTIIMVTEVNKELLDNPKANLIRTVVSGATNRLRPVLLTTVTTVAGLLPTAYGIGGKDALIMPLTLAMAYGLMFATLITLVLTPALLVIGHDIARLFGRASEHVHGSES